MDNPANRCIGYFLLSVAFFFAYKIFHKLDKEENAELNNRLTTFNILVASLGFLFLFLYTLIELLFN